jgi:serine O-acetyltransferase
MTDDSIWTQLRQQAETVAAEEPALRALLDKVILERASLEEALSIRLSQKLAYHAVSENDLREVFLEAFADNARILDHVRHDIIAVEQRDPACRGYLSPVLYFKGFHALTCYRIGHHLWNKGREHLALYLQSLISEVFAVDIHPAARIGCGVLLDHATGFVAGETSVVDDNVSILHAVTLGGTGKERGDRHPKIRSGVLIGAGAKILGNIEVGEGARIGAGSVVLHSVPPHVTVAGVPAQIVGQARDHAPALGMDHVI